VHTRNQLSAFLEQLVVELAEITQALREEERVLSVDYAPALRQKQRAYDLLSENYKNMLEAQDVLMPQSEDQLFSLLAAQSEGIALTLQGAQRTLAKRHEALTAGQQALDRGNAQWALDKLAATTYSKNEMKKLMDLKRQQDGEFRSKAFAQQTEYTTKCRQLDAEFARVSSLCSRAQRVLDDIAEDTLAAQFGSLSVTRSNQQAPPTSEVEVQLRQRDQLFQVLNDTYHDHVRVSAERIAKLERQLAAAR
jgi:hypothetical protein